MRIQVLRYNFAGQEDKNINFFTGVPYPSEQLDLYDYLLKDGMSEFSYEFEGVDTENSIYAKCSSINLSCANDIYNGTKLSDFFHLYTQNKYIKCKVNFYDEDDILFYSGIIQRDGIEINDLRDDILNITVIGYEKEFKDGYSNVPLDDITNLGIDLPPGPYMSIRGLYFHTAERLIKYLFGNIVSIKTGLFLKEYFVAANPYTFAGISRFEDYVSDNFHLKTGYNNFYRDEASKFVWFESLCLSMGWVWYFYLGQLIITERRDNDFDIYNIDYDTKIIKNSLSNRIDQFQCSNVIIKSGEYFSTHTQPLFNLSGTDTLYSNTNSYTNITRPYRRLLFDGNNGYSLVGTNHIYRTNGMQDEWRYNYTLNKYSGFPNPSYGNANSYDVKKSVIISPYIVTKDSAGGIDTENARTNTGAYYGNGNFYYEDSRQDTAGKILYTGHAGHSVVRYNSETGKLQTYEFYSQSENFKANFKKFVKVDKDIILEIEVAELITNPLQRIHISNFPYRDFSARNFVIELLSFNYFKKTTTLKIRII